MRHSQWASLLLHFFFILVFQRKKKKPFCVTRWMVLLLIWICPTKLKFMIGRYTKVKYRFFFCYPLYYGIWWREQKFFGANQLFFFSFVRCEWIYCSLCQNGALKGAKLMYAKQHFRFIFFFSWYRTSISSVYDNPIYSRSHAYIHTKKHTNELW